MLYLMFQVEYIIISWCGTIPIMDAITMSISVTDDNMACA